MLTLAGTLSRICALVLPRRDANEGDDYALDNDCCRTCRDFDGCGLRNAPVARLSVRQWVIPLWAPRPVRLAAR